MGDVRLDVDLRLGPHIPGEGSADLQRGLGERKTGDTVGSRATAVAQFPRALVRPAGSGPPAGQAHIYESSQPEIARLIDVVLSMRGPRAQ